MKILTVTFSECVKVNMGDYESRDAFVSCTVELEEGETIVGVGKKVRKMLRKELKVPESKMRRLSEEDVEFETMDRLDYYKK